MVVLGGACLIALAPDLPGVAAVAGVLRLLELRTYDARDALLHGPRRPTGHVVVVEIDEPTLAALGRWPFSRGEIAAAVEHAARSGAAVIALQMELNDRTSPAQDSRLEAVIAENRQRVVLVKGFGPDRRWRPLIDNLEMLVGDPERGDGTGPPLAMVEVDGSRRRVPLIWTDPPATPFCVVVAGRWTGTRTRSDIPGAVNVGAHLVPYSYDGTVVVHPPDYRSLGQTVSFIELLKGLVPAERLAGRIVLFAPPHNPMVDPHDPPGFVQAAAIEQILWGRPVTRVPPRVVCLAIALVVIALLVVFYRQTWWKSLPAVLGFLAVYTGLTVWLLAVDRIWLDLVLPLAAGFGCLALVGLAEGFHLKAVFGQLFPRELGQSALEAADARQLASVLDAARAMSTTLDVDALLDRLAACLASTVPHEWGAIHLVQSQSTVARRWPSGRTATAEEEAAEAAVRATLQPAITELGDASVLAVPMVVEGQVSGVVLLCASRSRRAFTRWHQDLVATLAFQVASLLRNAQLHREVVEAHQALAESKAQLVQTSKLAAVGQLAAGVAHEINNPLGAALVNQDAALRVLDTQPEKARHKLERARQALNRVRSIVEQLLDFSRNGGAPGVTSLEDVARDALELMGHGLGAEGVRVELDLGPAGPVGGHPSQLQQVVMNLLLNARDAVAGDPSRDRDVRVLTRIDGASAVLEVTDNGPGIPPDVVDRIFEPFFTTKPVGKGTGLGLWVSQRIAADHGGGLEVDTQAGGPTTFRLRVPLKPG